MTMVDEVIIRQRAHAIWESQGKPDGQDLEHWEQARRELLNGSSTPYTPVASMAAKTVKGTIKAKAPQAARK